MAGGEVLSNKKEGKKRPDKNLLIAYYDEI
jgi:hypothetical protein